MAKKKAPVPVPKASGPKCWLCGVVTELSPVTIQAAQRQAVVDICSQCRKFIESGDTDYLIVP